MEIENKIAPYQIFSMLFLCGVFSSLVYSPNIQPKATAGISFLAIFVANAILLVLIMPILSVISRKNNMDILDLSYNVLGKFGMILSAIYVIYFIYIAIGTLNYCNFFITSSLFPTSSVVLITLMLMIVCIYGSTVGINAIARFSFIALFFVLISFCVIIASVAPKADILNISIMGEDMLTSFIKSVNFNIQRNSEIVLMFSLVAFSSKSIKRGFIGFTTGLSSFFVLLTIVLISVLGKFLSTQIFPIYTLATMAEIPVIERLDALHISMWVLLGVIKATIYIFSALYLIKKQWGTNFENKAKWAIYLVVFIATIAISADVKLISFTDKLQYKFIFSSVLGVIIPMILVIIYKIKSRRAKR